MVEYRSVFLLLFMTQKSFQAESSELLPEGVLSVSELHDVATRLGTEVQVVRSRVELSDVHSGDWSSIWDSIRCDAKRILPHILALAGPFVEQDWRHFVRSPLPGDHDGDALTVIGAPGYCGPNVYLRVMADRHGLKQINHPKFTLPRIRGRIFRDARSLAKIIAQRESESVIIANSRGGLVALNALHRLQHIGLDHKVRGIVGVSPVVHGVRSEVSDILRYLPSRTVREMLSGSDQIRAWQGLDHERNYPGLSRENRRKILFLIPEGGDIFLDPRDELVEGGGALVVMPRVEGDTYGHIGQMVCPDSLMLRFAAECVKLIGQQAEQVKNELPSYFLAA